jgi:ABC-type uncharacterized transport system substrate-binding protein
LGRHSGVVGEVSAELVGVPLGGMTVAGFLPPGRAVLACFALALLTLPPAAHAQAQPAPAVSRVATLGAAPTQVWDAFQRRLRDLGYVEGHNLILERRWSQGFVERLPALVTELLSAKPDVLVASMFPPTARITPAQCVPIVAIAVGEPYGACPTLPVAHMSLTSSAHELSATHLRLAKSAIPSASRVTVVTNSTRPFLLDYVNGLQAAAATLGVAVHVLDVGADPDLGSLAAAIARQAPDALIVGPSFSQPEYRRQIVRYAARGRIPSIGSFLADGVVIAADYDWVELGRRAAGLVDQLLKGVKPADLRGDAPSKFEIVVDLRAAKALGLAIPDSLLAQADQVLE